MRKQCSIIKIMIALEGVMRRILFSSTIILVCCFFVMPVWAETFYVRSGCENNGDGTAYDCAAADGEIGAWNTFPNIQWGPEANEVGSADILYVCGEHAERMIIGASGTSGNPIIIDGNCSGVNASYTDGSMKRVSPENCAGSTNLCMNISVYNDEYLTIQNLSFSDPFGARGHVNTWHILQKHYIHDGGDDQDTFSYIKGNLSENNLVGGIIRNIDDGSQCIITANTLKTVTCKLEGGLENKWDNDDQARITADAGSIIIHGTSNNITIQNNSFDLYDEDNSGIGYAIRMQLWYGTIHDITIDNNTFTGDGEYVIQLKHGVTETNTAYNLTISNNTFTDILVGFDNFGTVEKVDPTSDHTGYSIYGVDINNNTVNTTYGSFINVRSGLREVVGFPNYIRNNTITNCGNPNSKNTNCFQLNWARGATIENNLIDTVQTKACDGVGIIIDWAYRDNDYLSDKVVVRYNYIKNAASPDCQGKGISVWKGTNTEVYYNIIEGSDVGIKLANPESIGSVFYNNTVYNSNDYSAGISNQAPASTWRNNIIHTSPVGLFVGEDSQEPTENHNSFYNNDINYENGSLDGTDITTKPQFVNAKKGDFRLKGNTPCRDVGVSWGTDQHDFSGTPVTDSDGFPINGEGVDIGAFEKADE